ncbi:MAG: thiamine ABC transporter substrate-binding protein, partial [Anaerolineae bacterium]
MKSLIALGLVGLLALTSCGQPAAPAETPTATLPPEPRTVRVMTHDSFDISEDVLNAFEEEHDAKVEILQAGDAGVVLNQAVLSKDNPLADVLYGVDNTLLSRALEADIFEPYQSAMLDEVPDHLEL